MINIKRQNRQSGLRERDIASPDGKYLTTISLVEEDNWPFHFIFPGKAPALLHCPLSRNFAQGRSTLAAGCQGTLIFWPLLRLSEENILEWRRWPSVFEEGSKSVQVPGSGRLLWYISPLGTEHLYTYLAHIGSWQLVSRQGIACLPGISAQPMHLTNRFQNVLGSVYSWNTIHRIIRCVAILRGQGM